MRQIFDWVSEKAHNALDWLADKVQQETGEKERRALLLNLKNIAVIFKKKIGELVDGLNKVISVFNLAINEVNIFRKDTVKDNIVVLFEFLSQFGFCKEIGEYAKESERISIEFPKKESEKIEKYIGECDWSNEEVFWDTFLRSPVGMKIKTRRQNLSMREQLHEIELQMEETINELEIRIWATEKEIKICELYLANIKFISEIIKTQIIPEMELIEAFFQAEKIKNEVIANKDIRELKFTYNINTLLGTVYEKHYRFIKNAFSFYIISCCIYNTPVLTNLLKNNVDDVDIIRLENEKKVLNHQAMLLQKTSLDFKGGQEE